MGTIDPQPPIAIIDDDEAIRDSLQRLFKSVGLPSLGFSTAHHFLAADFPMRPACLVLDVRMPGMSGLELQKTLTLRGDVTPVIFLTAHGDIPMAVEAILNGAFDFLEKPFRSQTLLERVRRALLTDRLNRSRMDYSDTIRRRSESLTPREHEVFNLMTRGMPNKVMATNLGVSQRTVEIHRARVMEKMSAESLAQLVRMSLELTPPAGESPSRRSTGATP